MTVSFIRLQCLNTINWYDPHGLSMKTLGKNIVFRLTISQSVLTISRKLLTIGQKHAFSQCFRILPVDVLLNIQKHVANASDEIQAVVAPQSTQGAFLSDPRALKIDF